MPGESTDPWVLAAAVPVCAGWPWWVSAAWGAALLLGTALPASRPFHWIGLGWIAAAAVPGLPVAATAASGDLGGAWRGRVAAVAAGLVLAVTLPAAWREAGWLLLAGGGVLALSRRRR